jgi:hypothetical protein
MRKEEKAARLTLGLARRLNGLKVSIWRERSYHFFLLHTIYLSQLTEYTTSVFLDDDWLVNNYSLAFLNFFLTKEWLLTPLLLTLFITDIKLELLSVRNFNPRNYCSCDHLIGAALCLTISHPL